MADVTKGHVIILCLSLSCMQKYVNSWGGQFKVLYIWL